MRRGKRTKPRSLLAIAFGVGAGTLLWSLSFLGYAPFAPADPISAALTWLPFALLSGFTAWLVLNLTSRTVRYRRSVIARLRVSLPAAGVGLAIFGVALSFTCDPTSCSVHPFEPYGVILSAIGLFVFLAGLTLAAAFPPEDVSVS